MLRQVYCGILLLLAAAAPAAAQTKLEWKFNEGDKFYQETTTVLNQTLKVMDQQIKQDMENTTVASFSVLKKNADGSLVVEQKIESIKSKNTGGVAPVGNIFRQMEGTTFRITFSPKMEITKFEGYNELIKKIGGDDAAVGKLIRSMMSEETLKHSVEEAFRFLPDGPVSKGATWQRKQAVPLGPLGNLNATNTYTYDGPATLDGKTLEKISFAPSITYQAPKGDVAGLPFQITAGNMKAEDAKGTMYFDAAAGRLVQSETKMRLKGSLTVSASGQKMTMDLDQEQTSKIRITTTNPVP
jgi:hypothetical protein